MLSDIFHESAAAQPIRKRDLDAFDGAGVKASTLAMRDDGVFDTICRDRVGFDGRRFEFERYTRGRDDIVNAFVLPVRNEIDELADIVAFRPSGETASWNGFPILGAEQIYQPRMGRPLIVRQTVMEWLGASRRGVVVLDHAGARSMLAGQALCTVSEEHAEWLTKMLTGPAPRVMCGSAAWERMK